MIESNAAETADQKLAREQERSSALQQELEQRQQQIEQLQAQVQQLRERAGEQPAAPNDTTGAGEPAAAAPAAEVPGAESEPAAATASETVAAAVEPAATAPVAPDSAPADTQVGQESAPPEAAVATSGTEANAAPEDQTGPAVVASLRAELVQEQERRQAAETELARLKEETSVPALADSADPATELVEARSQITELREALADERVERERMSDELRVLQQRAEHASPQEATPENAELQAQIVKLEAEKQAVVDSFNRSLAASQQRAGELERQLAVSQATAAAAATGVPANDAEAASIRAENSALRARLDEEHRRTEELAAKLRTASRVTDLIFKMQAQQVQARALPSR